MFWSPIMSGALIAEMLFFPVFFFFKLTLFWLLKKTYLSSGSPFCCLWCHVSVCFANNAMYYSLAVKIWGAGTKSLTLQQQMYGYSNAICANYCLYCSNNDWKWLLDWVWLCVLLTVVCPYGSYARMWGNGFGCLHFKAYIWLINSVKWLWDEIYTIMKNLIC